MEEAMCRASEMLYEASMLLMLSTYVEHLR